MRCAKFPPSGFCDDRFCAKFPASGFGDYMFTLASLLILLFSLHGFVAVIVIMSFLVVLADVVTIASCDPG